MPEHEWDFVGINHTFSRWLGFRRVETANLTGDELVEQPKEESTKAL